MKTRSSAFFPLFILTVLSLSIAGIFSPTGFAQKRASPSTQHANLDERIWRVETGLLPLGIIEPNAAMKLIDRMQFYKIPGVSITVINNGKIEWARGYGVLEAGGNKPVTPETLFQAASISKPVAAMAVL
jgi:CubicO group peptidase (beta-lactamase class C family)